MASATTEPARSARLRLPAWLAGTQGPLIGLVLLCVLFTATSNVFLSLRNALNIIDQVTVLGILALGMTAVIVIGGIDLSVGAILALSSMAMGWTFRDYALPFGLFWLPVTDSRWFLVIVALLLSPLLYLSRFYFEAVATVAGVFAPVKRP